MIIHPEGVSTPPAVLLRSIHPKDNATTKPVGKRKSVSLQPSAWASQCPQCCNNRIHQPIKTPNRN